MRGSKGTEQQWGKKNTKYLTKTFVFDDFWKKFCGKTLANGQNPRKKISSK